LVIGLLVAKLWMVSDYETTVVLRYEGDLHVGDLRPSGYALGPAADALTRQSVLRKIRDELGFEDTLTELAMWIEYELDFRSGALHFSVTGETGEDVAEYARVVTDVFLAYHKERQSRRIEEELTRTGKRIEAAEDEAEVARERYNEFREEHGIAHLSTEQQSMVRSAASLRANSELAVSEIRAVEAQIRSLEAHLASTPKTSFVSEGSSPERAEYNRLRGELASAKATLSAHHPRVQALEQQVSQLRSQLRAGGGASSSGGGLVSVNATYQVVEGQLREARSNLEALRERQKGLTGMADKAQDRVEAFSDVEGEASALLAEVTVNESLLSGLQGTEAALEDALRDPPSGFSVLDPGAAPEYPLRNRMKLVVFVAIPTLCIALALLLVLRREFQGLLLKTPLEVAFWGKGPVLAATSWPGDPHGLDELVAGLDDFAPQAQGSMLVVGASPGEGRLANELADRLNNDWFPTHEPRVAPVGRGPLRTPPPSGPYPIHPAGNEAAAHAQRPSTPPSEALRVISRANHLQLQAWDGPFEGQSLRRAARLADRVMIIVRSGAMSAPQLNRIQRRIGREHGVGYLVAGLSDEFRALPDRAGDVAGFWRS
jgi:predicted  nucleic acid-binding Zn-ribbon protein